MLIHFSRKTPEKFKASFLIFQRELSGWKKREQAEDEQWVGGHIRII